MAILWEILTILFWGLTYFLIILAGYRSRTIKKVAIPYVTGVLNISWEICALYWSSGFWGFWLWLLLDLAVIYFGYTFLASGIKKTVYILSIAFCALIFYFLFHLPNGMIYSVFAVDLEMAVFFLAERKRLSPILKIPVAITKLLGDLFAGIIFGPIYLLVAVLAVIVFFLNALYLFLCLRERGCSVGVERVEIQKQSGGF